MLNNPGSPHSFFYSVVSLLAGDLTMMAGRRIAAETWAKYGVDASSYRFDTVPAGISPETLGATHYQEISLVFHNTRGEGYESNPFNVSSTNLTNRLL